MGRRNRKGLDLDLVAVLVLVLVLVPFCGMACSDSLRSFLWFCVTSLMFSYACSLRRF